MNLISVDWTTGRVGAAPGPLLSAEDCVQRFRHSVQVKMLPRRDGLYLNQEPAISLCLICGSIRFPYADWTPLPLPEETEPLRTMAVTGRVMKEYFTVSRNAPPDP